MTETEALDMKAVLESKGEVEFKVCTLGKDVTIKKNMVSINIEKKKEHQRKFTPSVIEPSFGIGRIIYCLFEHCFYQRAGKTEDEQLNVFRFPPLVAPIKCTVFPLVKLEKFEVVAKKISKALTAAGISHIIDMTGTLPNKQTCAYVLWQFQLNSTSDTSAFPPFQIIIRFGFCRYVALAMHLDIHCLDT